MMYPLFETVCSDIERAIRYFHHFRDYLTERKSRYRPIVSGRVSCNPDISNRAAQATHERLSDDGEERGPCENLAFNLAYLRIKTARWPWGNVE